MEAVAKLRNCPMSARKMRLVVDLIRGKDIQEALNILQYTKKEAAEWLSPVLLSAIANWENRHGELSASEFDLYVSEARSDEAGFLKRFRPAPQGRAHRIRKRQNHVTIKVANRIDTEYDNAPAAETSEAEA